MEIGFLEKLPDAILTKIVDYLPQQDKLNLLYSNYHFYTLVQPLLYKNLIFTNATQLHRSDLFSESLNTLIGGLKTPLATESLNDKMCHARQAILLDSLTINPELCRHIRKIRIEGNFYNDGHLDTFEDVIDLDLYNYLLKNCPNLESILTLRLSNQETTNRVTKEMQLYKFQDFENLVGAGVTHLHIDVEEQAIDVAVTDIGFLQIFKHLETLTFSNEISQMLIFSKLCGILKSTEGITTPVFHFKNLKLIFYHNFDDPSTNILSLLNYIEFSALKRFELVLGCDDMTCSCLGNFIKFLMSKNLNLDGLSLSQKTAHREHNYTEKFDFYITEMIKQYPNKHNLRYLSIRHMPPNDFNVGDGFEGNYLHRRTLYENVLPLLSGLETLICPTFLQAIAGYEQLISDLLWNGCNCEHCTDYLPIFDQYILNHQYYDEMKSYMTDMISPILFGNVGKVLSVRLSANCDMFLESSVPLSRYWDFHSAPYDISHFEQCSIDKSAFLPIAVCVAHFLYEYVETIGIMIPNLKQCVLSGVFFDRISQTEGAGKWICSDVSSSA